MIGNASLPWKRRQNKSKKEMTQTGWENLYAHISLRCLPLYRFSMLKAPLLQDWCVSRPEWNVRWTENRAGMTWHICPDLICFHNFLWECLKTSVYEIPINNIEEPVPSIATAIEEFRETPGTSGFRELYILHALVMWGVHYSLLS